MVKYRFIIILFFTIAFLGCSRHKYANLINENKIIVLEDTIIIREKIDLNGSNLVVGSVIIFEQSGQIRNGSIKFNETLIINKTKNQIFDKVKITGKIKNDEFFLFWLTNGTNPKENFNALKVILRLNKICYLDKFYEIESNIPSYITEDIKISGINKEKCGLILLSKYSVPNAYFRSKLGNNISLSNISIITDDYRKGILPKGCDYHLASSYYSSFDFDSKPKIEFFFIDSCNLFGAVSFKYAVSSANTTPSEMLVSGIDSIRIINSKFEHTVSLIELSNGRFDNCLILKNEFKNIFGPLFFFPLGGMDEKYSATLLSSKRKLFVFRDNIVINEKPISSVGEAYFSSFVVKANEILIENNIFRNLINLNDKIESNPFYASALFRTNINNNKVTDCVGRGFDPLIGGSNCFLRIRGSKNVYCRNNVFKLSKNALVDLNLISNQDAKLSSVDVSKFRFSIWSANLNNTDFQSEYVFTNNTFNSCIITDHSIMSRSNLIFDSNNINIDYIPEYSSNNWNTSGCSHSGALFCFRDTLSDGKILFTNNNINIKELGLDRFYFTLDVGDNKGLGLLEYKGNTFNLIGDVSFATPSAKKIVMNNTHNGVGSFNSNSANCYNNYKNFKNVNFNSKIKEYKMSHFSELDAKMIGNSTTEIKTCLDSVINILDFNFRDLYHNNLLKKSPLIISIDVSYSDFFGKLKSQSYVLALKNFDQLLFTDGSNKIRGVNPIWSPRAKHFYGIIEPDDNTTKDIKLIITSKINGKEKDLSGYLNLIVSKNIKDIKVTKELKYYENNESERYYKYIKYNDK